MTGHQDGYENHGYFCSTVKHVQIGMKNAFSAHLSEG